MRDSEEMEDIMKEIVQLMYNPDTNHLHNSDVTDRETNGYYTIDFIPREKAFKFGGKIGKRKRTIEDMRERYQKFLKNNR